VRVSLDGVGHRFKNAEDWIFRRLSLDFVPGVVYGLTGPSGSGKSTLLSLIARLTEPAEGTVSHIDVGRASWVFQNPFGSPRRTALDHLTLPLLATGVSIPVAEERAAELLARFGLDEVAHRRFRELSGGEAQRLMLARGLASRPGLLLVDEPTAQLDRRTAERVDTAIAATADPSTIVIVATHDPRTRDACDAVIDLGSAAGGMGP
jgi:ABC-type lipoprotein export system ATPase subunit